jgi:hypothetical protein
VVEENKEEPDAQRYATQCRIRIEHYRARFNQLRAQIRSKELVLAADVKEKPGQKLVYSGIS